MVTTQENTSVQFTHKKTMYVSQEATNAMCVKMKWQITSFSDKTAVMRFVKALSSLAFSKKTF